MRVKEPFTVIKRQRKTVSVWFYRTYDKTGRRLEYSTGLNAKKTSKTAARAYVSDLLKDGKLIPISKTVREAQTLTFKAFAEDFFDSKSSFAVRRAASGRPYSSNYLAAGTSALKNHLMPAFGRRRLADIKRRDIEAFSAKLLEAKAEKNNEIAAKNSPKSVRNILQTLGVIFNEAIHQELISTSPVEGATLPSAAPRKRKESLRPEELQALFEKTKVGSIWRGDTFIRTAVLFAAATGARLGEVQALCCEDVFSDHVIIRHSWSATEGSKSTKSGKERIVPLIVSAAEALKELKEQRGKGLLFTYNNKKPISARHLQQRFSEALIAIDVNAEEQARRGLTFHALRVTFNTLIRSAGIMDSKIQAAVGHTSTAMTDRYTRFSLEDLSDLRLAVENVFIVKPIRN
jgi:integrase